MKRRMFVFCAVFLTASTFANNQWGGIGNTGSDKWGGQGLADGMWKRVQVEMQLRKQQQAAQEQRAAEERNRIMREEVRQREIEPEIRLTVTMRAAA